MLGSTPPSPLPLRGIFHLLHSRGDGGCASRSGGYARAAAGLALVASLCFLAACSMHRLPAVPQAEEGQPVTVDGMSGIRYWGDETSPQLVALATDALSRENAARIAAG